MDKSDHTIRYPAERWPRRDAVLDSNHVGATARAGLAILEDAIRLAAFGEPGPLEAIRARLRSFDAEALNESHHDEE